MENYVESYDIGGVSITIVFTHTHDWTSCLVMSGETRVTISGFARRHPREEDNVEVGKRFALKDALGIGHYWGYSVLPDDARKLWHAYRLAHSEKGNEYWLQHMRDDIQKERERIDKENMEGV